MAVAGLLIAGAILELGVRVLLGPQVRFPRRVVGSEFGLRINEPGARYTHRSADVTVDFRINSQGLRSDREFPYAKRPGLARIVSVGDSFALGYEVEADEVFSSILEQRLRAAGLDVEVLNAGVSGYSNAEALLYFERELHRYEPDVVLLSFFGNDLVDNVRSGLFRLEEGRLVPSKREYVPGGRLGDFLNTNPILGFLAERSNAFALMKERANRLVKRRVVAENVRNLEQSKQDAPRVSGRLPAGGDGSAYQPRLAAAILDRMYGSVLERGARLVIQSIPTRLRNPERLIEQFPLEEFDVKRPGLAFFAAIDALEPFVENELLYHHRSHGHWTPFSHRIAGDALADLILGLSWLASPSEAPTGSGRRASPARVSEGRVQGEGPASDAP